jgi:hypothetical protein
MRLYYLYQSRFEMRRSLERNLNLEAVSDRYKN